MKKIYSLALAVVLILSLSGCASQGEYNDLKEKYDSLQADYDELQTKYNYILEEYSAVAAGNESNNKTTSATDSSTETFNISETASDNQVNTSDSYPEGQYKVGKDIPEGEYVVLCNEIGRKGYCTVSADANESDLIIYESFINNTIVSIKDDEYITVEKCSLIPYEQFYSSGNSINTTCGQFMIKVGNEIAPGEYQVESIDGKKCYCTIYSDSRHNDMDAYDSWEGTKYIEIKDGQYLIIENGQLK